MFFQSLANQFLRDMKASWQKTALLGILFLVGLFFWIPPLWQAMTGGASSPATASGTTSPAPPHPVETEAILQTPAGASGESAATGSLWKRADEMLVLDPLVQSVEVAAIQSDPFRMDHEQLPPPILFAEDTDQERQPETSRQGGESDELPAPEGLTLKSTIVGVNRRAAFINAKLYQEGTEVQVDGETYRLTAVHPRRVVLTRGDAVFELKISPRAPEADIEVKPAPPRVGGK